MFITRMFLKGFKHQSWLGNSNIVYRNYALLFEKEFPVVPFCNIKIDLPINIAMIPLDVHKYRNCDRVIVKVTSNCENATVNIDCEHNEENVKISTNSINHHQGVTCTIEAPIKANINVISEKGNVSLLNFNGDNIHVTTKIGNITASRCHCSEISLISVAGNITCLNVMQAAKLYLKSVSGTIATGRLQGIDLNIQTENGNIKTESSYCTNSSFTTEIGHLDLQNCHKNCKVTLKKGGVLNMSGFDGVLQAELHKGEAGIQLARIEGNSEIKIDESGSLKLKVSDTCLTNTNFTIISESLHIEEELKRNINFSNGNSQNTVLINCRKSNVIIESLSWMEMFNLKR